MDRSAAELGALVFGRSFERDGAVVVRRASARIAAASAPFAALVGDAPEALIGRSIFELLDAGGAADALEPAPSGRVLTLTSAGGGRPVMVTASHLDVPRVGALAALRVREATAMEREHDEHARAIAALDEARASLEARARDAGAPSVRGERSRRLAAIAGALGRHARAAALGVAPPDEAPRAIDVGGELALAIRLAEARAPGARFTHEPAGVTSGFAAPGALHRELAAALDHGAAHGGCAIELAARGATWVIAIDTCDDVRELRVPMLFGSI